MALAAAKTSTTEAALKTSRAMRELHRRNVRSVRRAHARHRSGGAHRAVRAALRLRAAQRGAGLAARAVHARGRRREDGRLSTRRKSASVSLRSPRSSRAACCCPTTAAARIPTSSCRSSRAKPSATAQRSCAEKSPASRRTESRVQAIVLDGKLQPVERVVIAAGAASGELSAKLGTPLPVEAERGYHITIGDPGVDAAHTGHPHRCEVRVLADEHGAAARGDCGIRGHRCAAELAARDAAGGTGAAHVPRRERWRR